MKYLIGMLGFVIIPSCVTPQLPVKQCTYAGKRVSLGVSVMRDCNECICTEDGFLCSTMGCN